MKDLSDFPLNQNWHEVILYLAGEHTNQDSYVAVTEMLDLCIPLLLHLKGQMIN